MAKVNKKQAGLKRNTAQKNITLKGMVFTKHTKHEYDVDIKDILTTLGKLCQRIPQTHNKQSTTALLAELEMGVGIYRTKYGISDKDYNNLPHLVVPSKEYAFQNFISWKLAIIDIPEIDLFLDHHFDTFEGNYYAEKNNFVGLLHHIIYPQVMLHSFVDTATRLDRIMKWVRENKDNRQPTPLRWVGEDKSLKSFPPTKVNGLRSLLRFKRFMLLMTWGFCKKMRIAWGSGCLFTAIKQVKPIWG